MKNILLLLFLVIGFYAHSQVSITNDGSLPHNSAMLDVKSTDKGILLPRMTQAQRNLIASPAIGLMIYQTDNGPGFYYNSGTGESTAWAVVGGQTGWNLTGNSETNPAINFIGTSDTLPLIFKVNNQKAGYIDFDFYYGNTSLGYLSLNSNIGNNNSAFGYMALYSNTYGAFNTANGMYSLMFNTNGYYNTANGLQALYSNTTGNYNTANAVDALRANTTGYQNTANGYQVLYSNTTGYANTAVGAFALFSGTTDNNTAIGRSAGYFAGTNSTFIGAEAYNNTLGYSNNTVVGYGVSGTGSNQVRIGNSNITSIGGFVNWSNISDGRFKENIQDDVKGLEFINKLQPVTYTLDITGLNSFLRKDMPMIQTADGKTIEQPKTDEDGITAKEKIIYSGFIAQDVEAAAKEVGYDFSGVDVPKNDQDVYGLRYAEFVVPLVKAVQELNAINEAQKVTNEELQLKISQLMQRIDKLENK